MEINIKRSSRRTVAIKIDERGIVSVLCPKKFPLKEIDKIIETKKHWIIETVNKINDNNNQTIDYITYKKVLIDGISYDVLENEKNVQIGDIILKKRKNIPLNKFLKQFFINQAKQQLTDRLQLISSKTNLMFNQLSLSSARKKWGSCDNRKNITLNYRLVMLPRICLDYVCVHELCHTRHMNHSKQFWLEVEKLMPNYQLIKKQMKKYSFTLNLF